MGFKKPSGGVLGDPHWGQASGGGVQWAKKYPGSDLQRDPVGQPEH